MRMTFFSMNYDVLRCKFNHNFSRLGVSRMPARSKANNMRGV